ncbi:Cysteinyl-tRNA synthetase [hydrothermal vent metagenome]|uniref:Cysteine--tRNA ligase n=1 Tax=hydrothermal vent metagenome TaxID=652676 RepID=A0A3B0U290_9ZZZZ
MNSQTSPKLRFFNTATKTKQNFVPLDKNNVRLYVCGPTVYDYAHIGNARPAIVFDVLFRLLRHVYGFEHVTYVRNITDVDDKINARAVRDFPDVPLNEAIQQLTKKTEIQYQDDMAALGCLEPSLQPRATGHIGEMIEMIETLLKKGNAYVADGHVLFDVKSFKRGDELLYGRLARRSLDDMLAGARIEVAPYKRDAMDFVMWKPSAENEPGWASPWGLGRPGWHIECSAMSRKYLGEVFDIHGGGIDLSFPHHENELAQSCCANNTDKMAQIWMHNGFLQVEGEKMSKSLGNFFTVDELLNTTKFGGKKWPGNVLRLAILMTNYREPIDFSRARLEEASAILRRWKSSIVTNGLRFEDKNKSQIQSLPPCSKMLAALADDINMAGVMANLHRHAGGKKLHNGERLFGSLKLLGLVDFNSMRDFEQSLRDAGESRNETAPQIEAAIAGRLKAISEKNWTKADNIRDQLAAKNIQLMDYKDPETGEKRTKWEVKQ